MSDNPLMSFADLPVNQPTCFEKITIGFGEQSLGQWSTRHPIQTETLLQFRTFLLQHWKLPVAYCPRAKLWCFLLNKIDVHEIVEGDNPLQLTNGLVDANTIFLGA